MTEEEIKLIVRETLLEERRRLEGDQDEVILKTMSAILKGFGINAAEEEEVREDFRYLRRWRKGSDKVTGLGVTALVTLLVGGVVSALWLGLKQMIGK